MNKKKHLYSSKNKYWELSMGPHKHKYVIRIYTNTTECREVNDITILLLNNFLNKQKS